MALLDSLVGNHQTVMERAREADARFYDTLTKASYIGVGLSGVGAMFSSYPGTSTLLVLTFTASALHFGKKSVDASIPGYFPSERSLEKARDFGMAGN